MLTETTPTWSLQMPQGLRLVYLLVRQVTTNCANFLPRACVIHAAGTSRQPRRLTASLSSYELSHTYCFSLLSPRSCAPLLLVRTRLHSASLPLSPPQLVSAAHAALPSLSPTGTPSP